MEEIYDGKGMEHSDDLPSQISSEIHEIGLKLRSFVRLIIYSAKYYLIKHENFVPSCFGGKII